MDLIIGFIIGAVVTTIVCVVLGLKEILDQYDREYQLLNGIKTKKKR